MLPSLATLLQVNIWSPAYSADELFRKMYELQSHREFSPLDEMLPAFYYCFLLCFPLEASLQEPTQRLLKSSLSALGAGYPYLTGNVRTDLSSKVRKAHLLLDIPEPFEDIPIVFKDLRSRDSGWTDSYQQLKDAGMHPRKLDPKILAPLTAGIGETRKVLSVQANFVKGGLLLAMCFHHNFVDAYGAGRIIARFSEHCCGVSEAAKSTSSDQTCGMPDVLTIEKVQASHKFEDLKHNSELWQLNCLDWKDPPEGHVPFEWPDFIPSLLPVRQPPVVTSMFSFSTEALKELKRLAQPPERKAWVSTNDALVAFLWRHIMRARFQWAVDGDESRKEELSSVVVALDGREDLSVSPRYVGNCLFHCFTYLPISRVGDMSTPLSDISIKIRQTVNKTRNPKLLADVVGLAATIPNRQTIRYANDNLGKDVYTTSWVDLPLYRLNWGALGQTDFFRIPDRHFESLCCILPPREGVVELIISMEEGHTNRLQHDEEFAKFAKLR